MRHLTTTASHAFMQSSAARMISAACLLASRQSFLLIGSEQAFTLLHRFLADLAHLLLFLLRRERSTGADILDLGMCLVCDGVDLLRHGRLNTGLLHAISLASAPHRTRL